MIPVSLQSCLSFALIVFLLLPSSRIPLRFRGLLLLALLVMGIIPLPTGLSLAGYLRGVTDELSIIAMVWMLAGTGQRLGWLPSGSNACSWQLCSVFAVLGVLLYPASMGVGMLDTYGWGYSPRILIALIGVLTLAFLLLGNMLGVLMLTLATLAFTLDIKASDNYWDYLIDPFVVCYSIGVLVSNSVAALLAWRRSLVAPATQLDEGVD